MATKCNVRYWIGSCDRKQKCDESDEIWIKSPTELIAFHKFPSFGSYTIDMQYANGREIWIINIQELFVLSLKFFVSKIISIYKAKNNKKKTGYSPLFCRAVTRIYNVLDSWNQFPYSYLYLKFKYLGNKNGNILK